MNVIIIEDEPPARAKLVGMLHILDTNIHVVAQLGSVIETLAWLTENKAPDLAFVDIQLSDDHSFEIFRRHSIKFPVIFTTAYDKYVLESFEFNSIDYLLKPITHEKLIRSLEKVKLFRTHFQQEGIANLIARNEPSISRIVARKGADFVALSIEEVAYFFSEHKVTFVRDFAGRQFMIDRNLAELEASLNQNFFRLNRKFIAHLKAIERFKSGSGKIQIFLRPELKEEVFVSKETAPDFRKWIGV